jgi:hypothetical protein
MGEDEADRLFGHHWIYKKPVLTCKEVCEWNFKKQIKM